MTSCFTAAVSECISGPMEKANGPHIVPPEQLAACSKALTTLKITSPPARRVLRLSRSAAVRLLRLHSKAG